MEKGSVILLIMAFVSIIIGVGLLTSVSTEAQDVTTFTYAPNESIDITTARNAGTTTINATINFTLTNAPTSWKASGGCPISSVSVRSGNGTALTENTDYELGLTTGVISFIDTVLVNQSTTDANTTTVDYYYCPDGYIDQAWSRTVLNMVPGFYALGLLGIGVGLILLIGKKEGWIQAWS